MPCVIRTIEDLRRGRTPQIGAEVTEIEATNLVRLGGDVIVAGDRDAIDRPLRIFGRRDELR